jgi:hypothetical protein
MTEAAALQPGHPLGARPDAPTADVDIGAARVFTEPVTDGETVTITATVLERAGRFGAGRGRPIAVIEADADGVRVHHVVDLRRIGLTLLAAALIASRASAVFSRRVRSRR